MAVVGNLQINCGASTAQLEEGMARAVRSIQSVQQTAGTTSTAVAKQMGTVDASMQRTAMQGASMASSMASSIGAGGPLTSALAALDRALIYSEGNAKRFFETVSQGAAVAAVAYVAIQFRKQAAELDKASEQLEKSIGRMKAMGMAMRLQAAKESFLEAGGTEEQWRGGRGAATLARLRAQEGDTSTLETSAQRRLDRATRRDTPESLARGVIMREIAAGREITDDAVRRIVAMFEQAEEAQKRLNDLRAKNETMAERHAREIRDMNTSVAAAIETRNEVAVQAAFEARNAIVERQALEIREERERRKMAADKAPRVEKPLREREVTLGGEFAGAAQRGSVEAYRAIIGSQTYGQQTAKNTARIAQLQDQTVELLRNQGTTVVAIQ